MKLIINITIEQNEMKKFKYNGSGALTFTHQGQDYCISKGLIHTLPTDSDLVVSLVASNLLTEVK